jgi:hypothetical protein
MTPSLLLDPDDLPSFPDVLAPAAVQALAARGVRRGLTAAFQGLLAASVDAVTDAVGPVRAASEAAINLAQQQHVAAVADGLTDVAEALRSGLSAQGRALLPAPRRGLRDFVSQLRARPERATPSWGEAMVDAADALTAAAEFVATLAAAQPEASSARILGEGLAARLARDRDAIVDEAARTGA